MCDRKKGGCGRTLQLFIAHSRTPEAGALRDILRQPNTLKALVAFAALPAHAQRNAGMGSRAHKRS